MKTSPTDGRVMSDTLCPAWAKLTSPAMRSENGGRDVVTRLIALGSMMAERSEPSPNLRVDFSNGVTVSVPSASSVGPRLHHPRCMCDGCCSSAHALVLPVEP